jgi:Pentapeptide repeats (8 copies)
LDVRLGGIYALERIARDSPADRATIGEVLTAFVRGHAPWPPRLPGQDLATAPIDDLSELPVRAPDVQASLIVLGRGGFARLVAPDDVLDLSAVDLRRARLPGVHFEHVYLGGTHLERVYLGGAHLEMASLRSTHLEAAVLFDAHLEGADLTNAHLETTILAGVNLKGAFLRGAQLEGAFADADIVWPAGFDWRAAGVIMAGEDTAEKPPQPA